MIRKNYFLVGIGGISMSGIAKLLKLSGNKVTGSDVKENAETKLLKKMGIRVIIGQNERNISSNIDTLIYSSAANQQNSPGIVEIERARQLGIPIYKRSQFIGKLMEDKIGITVAGMHGKTTITAMLGLVFKELKKFPVVLVGGEFSNFSHLNLEYPRIGFAKSRYLICEGCEYDRSFLDFNTKIGIISNIEEEHLDYFKGGITEILEAFKKFISQIPKDGFLVVNGDDKNIKSIIKFARCEVIRYSKAELKSLKTEPSASYGGWIKLKIPGIHNQLNALAVLKLTEKLGFSKNKALKILEDFQGVSRRFEYLGKIGSTIFLDDYAHHPTEIQNTLKSLNDFYRNKKILIIFQPHQYSRTQLLFKYFVNVLKNVRNLAITDVYEAVGRDEKKEIGSKELVNEISKYNKNTFYLPNYNDVFEYIKENYLKYDIIMTMGAGPINTVANKFINVKSKLNQKSKS